MSRPEPMADVYEIRRRNLLSLVEERASGNLARFVEIVLDGAVSYNGLHHVIGPQTRRNLGPEMARTIEVQLRLARGWMDHDHSGLESGDFSPALEDFFRFASRIGQDPILMFIDLVAEWRREPTASMGLYKTRATDFARLYRLGYHEDIGDFRELPATYGAEYLALQDAETLNIKRAARTRKARKQKPIDTLVTYVRVVSRAIPR